ncbi:MAG TPA: hypothetical protein VGD91_12975 [Trebonia sp.]
MGWIVALPALVALYVINKRFKGKGKAKKAIAITTMAVAAAAGVGLVFTFVGVLVADVVGWIAHGASTLSGDNFAVAIPLAVTLLAIGIAVADIAFDKKADRGAQIAAVLFPTLLALVVGGALHKTGGAAVDQVHQQMQVYMTRLGGS